MTQEEKFVRDELGKIYPQLRINCQKVLGFAFDRFGDDLLSIAVEFFLEKDLEQQLETIEMGKLENFITYIMKVQSISNTSRFYSEIRKFSNNSREVFEGSMDYLKEDEYEISDVDLCLKQAVSTLDPYERMIIEERVYKGRRFKDIAETYDIPYSNLSATYNKIIKKLKRKCSHIQL